MALILAQVQRFLDRRCVAQPSRLHLTLTAKDRIILAELSGFRLVGLRFQDLTKPSESFCGDLVF